MECNKDEALRAKEIADKKLTEMDVAGAKKFALKAKNLFPGLEGLSDLLAVLDLYISAKKKINGEVDWYSVIGVEPSADGDTIRRHYRRLVLTLHPDKNKSVGADGAFKILSEAWSLLSDKDKRIAYDQKRNFNIMAENLAAKNPSVPADQNGFPHSVNAHYWNRRHQKTARHPKPSPPPPPPPPPPPHNPPKPSTFWTVCHSCATQFEYHIDFFCKKLMCPNDYCRKPFVAQKIPPPDNVSYITSLRQHQNPVEHMFNSYGPGMKSASAGFAGFDSHKNSTFQSAAHSKSAGVGSQRASASSASRVAAAVDPSCKQPKRRHEEPLGAATGAEALQRKPYASKKMGTGLSAESSNSTPKGDRPKKKRCTDEHRLNAGVIEMMKQKSTGNGEFGVGSISGFQKGSFEAGRVHVAGKSKPNNVRELSQLEIRNMLMQKAKKEIGNKLNEWSMAAASKTLDKSKASGKEVKEKEKKKEKPKAAVNGVVANASQCIDSVDDKKKVKIEKVSPADSRVVSDMNSSDPMSMSVPDPDFHDFDRDRTEKSFGDNQVWAAYDDDDGMPRFYAIVHSVISVKPFKIKLSWLNSKSNNELGPINWIGSGFYKTCGDFRIGRYEDNDSLNSFSHKVKWTKGTKGAIQIYPVKGDVWALYRNWSPDWNELTPDEVIQKYDMVEALEDCNEKGVTVAPLVKVEGYKTVFRRHSDPKEIRMIPREEMFRFSHQVPSYKLTGQEGQNAPKDCWELDPAATPLELLQVTEVNDGEVVETTKDGIQNSKGKEVVGSDENKIVEKVMVKKGSEEAKQEGMKVYNRRR